MSFRKEYFILIGVIAVLLVFLLIGGGRSKMSYRVPRLENVNPDEITKIEISKEGQTVVLSKKDDKWTIMPQEYTADPDKVSNMLDTVENLTLTELAAERKDYQRYELDEEKKIGIKAFKGDEVVRMFDIGKVSPTYRHTFVTVGKDPRVYHARDSFRSTFDFDRAELRDKSVMSFDKNEITQVKITQDNATLDFAKKMLPVEVQAAEKGEEQPAESPAQEEAWVTEDGTKGKTTEIDSILNQLTDLKCDDFIEDKTMDDFTGPVYTVSLTGTKDYMLQIFSKDEEAGKYPALSSENPYPFFLTAWKAENIMKKADDLLDKKKEDE